jgi:transposase
MAIKHLKIDIETQADLYNFIDKSKKPQERKRAMAILMNSNKESVKVIAKKLEKNPDTIYDWLNNFTAYGIDGIRNKPIPGRPKKLKKDYEESIKEVLKKSY